jgi:hypothetical protein
VSPVVREYPSTWCVSGMCQLACSIVFFATSLHALLRIRASATPVSCVCKKDSCPHPACAHQTPAHAPHTKMQPAFCARVRTDYPRTSDTHRGCGVRIRRPRCSIRLKCAMPLPTTLQLRRVSARARQAATSISDSGIGRFCAGVGAQGRGRSELSRRKEASSASNGSLNREGAGV